MKYSSSHAGFLNSIEGEGTTLELLEKLRTLDLVPDLLDVDPDRVDQNELRRALKLNPLLPIDRYGRTLITFTGLGLTAEKWISSLRLGGHRLSDSALDILSQPHYNEHHRLEPGKSYTAALVLAREIKKSGHRQTENFRLIAERDYGKTEPFKAELVLLARQAISDRQMARLGIEYLSVLHEPIVHSDRRPRVFTMDRNDDRPWIHTHWGYPHSPWRRNGAFLVPASE